jgi:uncharacterized Zn-binding protein involved in type VI secretion
MPQLTFRGAMSKGLDGPATALTKKIQSIKSYVGGVLVGTVGDQFESHISNSGLHQNEQRQIVSGASKTYFEGNLAARINDPIADGDQVGEGNAKTFVE